MSEDWLKLGYVLESPTTPELLLDLIDCLSERENELRCQTKLRTVYWKHDGTIESQKLEPTNAVETVSNYQTYTIYMSYRDFELAIGKNAEQGCLSSVPHIVLSERVDSFRNLQNDTQPDSIEESRLRFTRKLADAAIVIDPKWGFGRRGGLATEEGKSVADLAARVRPPLYEYNVFREEMVEEIGRERLTSSPAWYIEELDTGGVFLAVRKPPKSCGQQTEECLEVANHLGLSLAKPSQYH